MSPPTCKPNRILRCPAACLGVVVPVAEPYQASVSVVHAAGEAEWELECRGSVGDDVAE